MTDTAPATELDPGVELLPDVPIPGPDADALGRGPVAARLVELACAQPVEQPRVVALVASAGAGKTSVLRLVAARLDGRGDCGAVHLDAADHATGEALRTALVEQLLAFFTAAGVVEAKDAVRDKLARHGTVVSGVARLAGVKVDVGTALRRSSQEAVDEIAGLTHAVGRRLAIVIDHLDRMAIDEVAAALAALRPYATLPYVTIVLAIDRRATRLRLAARGGGEALDRLVGVELAVPPADPRRLARLVGRGLARASNRLDRDLDAALALFDPDGDDPVALALLDTPRDALRVVNALTAALPLIAPDVDLRDACLELVLRLLVPELDTPRLDADRRRHPAGRAAARAELIPLVAASPRAAAACHALRALLGG
ncbi:MAG: hypothetical protein H6709_21805 [Kofleriaceae bacterium]|nr:hypothetical protein [Kofleriaceae bacterium]MCB9574720.1 hypothetical protein [Kofleriaceae bacterium]